MRKSKNKLRSLIALALLPSASFAYSTSDDALTDVLTQAVDYAQSGPARALCVLAIAGAGYAWITAIELSKLFGLVTLFCYYVPFKFGLIKGMVIMKKMKQCH